MSLAGLFSHNTTTFLIIQSRSGFNEKVVLHSITFLKMQLFDVFKALNELTSVCHGKVQQLIAIQPKKI